VGKTIASVHTTESELRSGKKRGANIETATKVGNSSQNAELPRRLSRWFSIAAEIAHGKVKALAEAAREGGP
jgi:ribosomal protein L18